MAEEKKVSADTPEKTSVKKTKKAKKPNLFKRMGSFFKEYRSELKKVTWYPASRVIHDTGVVVAALAVCGAAIGVLDLILTRLILLIGQNL